MTLPDHMSHELVVSAAPQTSRHYVGLEPIERLWDALDQRVRSRNPAHQTLSQLLTALQHEWQNFSQRVVQRFIASMHRHYQTIIKAGGKHNRY